MEIDVKSLSTYSVADDGKKVILRLKSAGEDEIQLSMDVDQLGTLAITLPGLIEMALRRRFKDASLRYSYELGPSSIEQASDPHSLIFNLQTCDGFGVSFTVSRQQATVLSEMLATSASAQTAIVSH
jgi:hypothetical protein